MKRIFTILSASVLLVILTSLNFNERVDPMPIICFAEDSSELKSFNDDALNSIYSFFEEKPNGVITLTGYNSETERDSIAFERALNVQKWFMEKGIDESELLILNAKEENPKYLLERQLTVVDTDTQREALKTFRVVMFMIKSW